MMLTREKKAMKKKKKKKFNSRRYYLFISECLSMLHQNRSVSNLYPPSSSEGILNFNLTL